MEEYIQVKMVSTEGLVGVPETLVAPSLERIEQNHKRTWVSDTSFEAVGGLCL